jgi:hypothetical protein
VRAATECSVLLGFCLGVMAAADAATSPSGALGTQSPAAGIAPARSRLGLNLSGPADWSTELPFVDVFRLSREWISQKKGAKWGEGPKLDCDIHGWVKRLETDGWAETPVLTAGHAPSGEYVCLYDGDGTIEFNNVRKIVSRTPGRIVVDIDGAKGGVFLQVRQTNPANYVRNIRLIMPGFEKTYRQDPFYPPFLERWRSFNTFRFMDWTETNGSKISRWEDRPTPDSMTFTARGIPVEVMVDLCNRLKINPWFCMPHLATDDYVQKFAEKVKAALDPSLKVYIEYSNEVWNSGFEQCRYAQDQARRLGLGPKDRPWEGGAMFYAQRSVEIFGIWEKVFGGRERLVRVVAWQAASGDYWTDGLLLGYKDTARHVDALAIAPYISFGIPEKADDPKELSAKTVAGWSLDQLFDHLKKKSLPECLGWVAQQKKVADKYSLKLLAYEAGQHLVGVGGGENNEGLTRLFHAANRDPRMGALYTQYLDGWKAAGGDLLCLFASTSAWSKWGSWGLSQYMAETETDQPKLRAVMEWNRRNPR